MARRFADYQPSTALRQAITAYRAARLNRIADDMGQSGRAQQEGIAAHDAPGTDATEGEAARQGDEQGRDHK